MLAQGKRNLWSVFAGFPLSYLPLFLSFFHYANNSINTESLVVSVYMDLSNLTSASH